LQIVAGRLKGSELNVEGFFVQSKLENVVQLILVFGQMVDNVGE